MIEPRLATHVFVAAIRRTAEAEGGFATILAKGDPVSGSLLLIRREKGANPALFERLPTFSGGSKWEMIAPQDVESEEFISDYCERRCARDPDLWIVELDVPFVQRFTDIIDTIS